MFHQEFFYKAYKTLNLKILLRCPRASQGQKNFFSLNHHNLKWIEQQFKDESDKELLDLICILKLAEFFSHLSGYIAQVPTNHEWLKISDTIIEYLDLNTMKLEKLKRSITEKLSEIKI